MLWTSSCSFDVGILELLALPQVFLLVGLEGAWDLGRAIAVCACRCAGAVIEDYLVGGGPRFLWWRSIPCGYYARSLSVSACIPSFNQIVEGLDPSSCCRSTQKADLTAHAVLVWRVLRKLGQVLKRILILILIIHFRPSGHLFASSVGLLVRSMSRFMILRWSKQGQVQSFALRRLRFLVYPVTNNLGVIE